MEVIDKSKTRRANNAAGSHRDSVARWRPLDYEQKVREAHRIVQHLCDAGIECELGAILH
jgi:hypothetical protein